MTETPAQRRAELLMRLRAKIARGEAVVGGGAGTGLSAKCEEAGGIDLVVIYNSGRYRMAGRGSLAGLMAYGNANEIVLDMVNVWALDTVPPAFASRRLHRHNAQVTLMRTTGDENVRFGAWIAAKLNRMAGPVRFLLPLGGVSALDAPGQPFWDPKADAMLFDALRRDVLQTDSRRIVEVHAHINDPAFAAEAVRQLLEITP